ADGHVEVVVDVPETVRDHRVEDLGVAEVEALAGPRHEIRRPGHVLSPSRDDDRIGVVLDRAHALAHRLHPAAAAHVHGGPALALRNPRENHDLAGTVLVEPRLDHGPE